MKKIILILFISFCPIIFGQNSFFNKKEIPVFRPNIHTQFLNYKLDDDYQITYLYKIPFSRLVFEKVNDHFESQFELTIEVMDQNNKVLKREFVKDKLISYNFDETISHTKFLENFNTLILPKGKYTFRIIFEDKLTNRQRPQAPVVILLEDSVKKYSPILVEKKIQDGKFIVANFSGVIPFGKENFDLIFFTDKVLPNDKIKVKFVQKDSVYFEQILSASGFGKPVFEKLNDKISLSFDSSFALNGILIKDVNKKLSEGDYQLKLFSEDGKEIESYVLKVTWFNKPFSLNDIDFSLEMISNIESDNILDSFMKQNLSSEELLKQYWKSKDLTPETAFNELMEVFYDRVDYAESNFRNLSGTSGAKSDRGKVYIRNGAPDKIERGVNSDGKITETWSYDNPKRIFVFVDIRGDGSFRLESK
ncbi:MAG: GWxTD domain-containing protein [Ignavibacterium sp.]